MNTHEENVAIATAAVVETLYTLTEGQAAAIRTVSERLADELYALAYVHAMAEDAREEYRTSITGRVARVLAVAAGRA